MAYLNKIKNIPFNGDEVVDVKFALGYGRAVIVFKSGKEITISIDDNSSYSRKDYWTDYKKNNRDISIKNVLDGKTK